MNAWGGGHISVLAIGSVGNNDDGYEAQGTVTGGSINVTSRKDITPYSIITTGANNFQGQTAFHGGSIMMKADGNLNNLAFLGGTSGNPLMGQAIRLKAGNNFVNLGTIDVSAGGKTATGPSQAGLLTINAGNELRIGNQSFGGPTMLANGIGALGSGGFIHLKAKTITTPSLDYLQANGTAQAGTIMTEGTIQIDPPF